MKNLLCVLLATGLLASTSTPARAAGAIISAGSYLQPAPERLEDLVKVAAADLLSFGLRADGRVVAWGDDSLGLYDAVDPAASYLDVALGQLHVLLLLPDGSIVAYGGPDWWFPITPPEPNSGYTAVAAGTMLSAALRGDGSVVTWGSNPGPVPAPNAGFTAIAVGGTTVYALRDDGSIAAWGNNTYGQLDVPAPNSGFVAVSGGEHFAVALRDDGSLATWGRNNVGQLNVPLPNAGFERISAGQAHALAVRADGSVAAWGLSSLGRTTVPAPNTGFTAVAAGFSHSVGLRDDGSMVAWGNKSGGACGVIPRDYGYVAANERFAIREDGSLWLYLSGTAPPSVPAPNVGFVHVDHGGTFYLALRGNGTIAAWGDNYSGQLNVAAPNSGYADFAVGSLHVVALRTDGTIEAWGDNGSGQTNIPEPDGIYTAVAAGNQHGAALRADGSVSVWGYNVPVPSPSLTGYVAIAAGRYHTMALHEDGHIDVWSLTAPNEAIPAPNSGFVAISASGTTNAAMREDGSVVAWGTWIWDQPAIFTGHEGLAALETAVDVVFAIAPETVVAAAPDLPASAAGPRLGALPNPFNPSVCIWFTSPRDDHATVDVHDVAGRRIRSLWRGDLFAGERRSADWDGRDDAGSRVASGTYLVILRGAHGDVATRQVTLVK